MKNLMILSVAIFALTGCGGGGDSFNSASKWNAMCSNQELLVCGDNLPISNSAYEIERPSGWWRIEDDPDDIYKYSELQEDNTRHGDCEDFVITLIEDNLRSGVLQAGDGDAEIILGKAPNGTGHAWAIIKKENEYGEIVEFFYDIGYKTGIEYEKLKKQYNFEAEVTLYRT